MQIEGEKMMKKRIPFGTLIVSIICCMIVTMWSSENISARKKSDVLGALILDENKNLVGTEGGESWKTIQMSLSWMAEDTSKSNNCYRIKANAFQNCPNLKNIVIPFPEDSYGSIQEVDAHAFDGCSSKLTVYCPANTYLQKRVLELGIKWKDYDSKKWDAISRDSAKYVIMNQSREIIAHGASGLNVTFPKTTKKIGSYAFANVGFDKVTIPASVVDIEGYAFRGSGMRKVVFQKGKGKSKYKVVRSRAFADTCLESVQFAAGVTSIEKNAFQDNDMLKKIYIPSSCKRISRNMFGTDRMKRQVTIYGKKGSAAIAFAKKNGYQYKCR